MSNTAKEVLYNEVCATYRTLDDFRAKLLGLLPLASGAGILATLVQKPTPSLSVVAVLGALVTIGLGIHEYRTIVRCEALKDAGRKLEQELGYDKLGLFGRHPDDWSRRRYYPYVSTGTASAVVYGVVFVVWIFVALWPFF